jgi:hypothetical protein
VRVNLLLTIKSHRAQIRHALLVVPPMKQPVLIPYRCSACASTEAEMSSMGSRLKCRACGRDHGFLNDVRAALREEARQQAKQRVLQAYPLARRVARGA